MCEAFKIRLYSECQIIFEVHYKHAKKQQCGEMADMCMDNNIGKKLDGRYELIELIGVGGMADIYKARDITEDRIVAVKILKNEYVGSEDFIRRFRNESKAIALLSHPNIVKIYDVGFTEKLQFIVMEYIDGITLTDYIAKEGVLKWKDVVSFTLQILKALQHAHDRGIVHRDIKPQNVMLLSDGTIKVMDFGIARFNRETDKTVSEKAIGSVHYISPEQAKGDVTDERSDIYSLGVMMYEMLTGKKPFDGNDPIAIALLHMQSTPKKMSEINNSIPEGLEEITEKAMQKEPSKRYQTAGEMMKDIEEFKQNPSIVFEYKYFSADGTTKYFDKVTPDTKQAKNSPAEKSGEIKKGYAISDIDNSSEEGENGEEADYEDDEVAPRRSPLLSILFAATAVFVIVAAIVVYKLVSDTVGGNPNVPGPSQQISKEVTVPTFMGMTEDQVKEQYGDQFNLRFTHENSTEPKDQVINQSIGAGTTIKSTQQISLTISLGPKMEEIDEFKSRPKDEAVTQLRNQGFETEVVWDEDETIPYSYVIRTDPPARERVQVGSKVIIFVSQGPSPTLTYVPDFKGLTEYTARQNAERNDIVLLVEYGPSPSDKPVDKGKVISQSIEPNEKVEKQTVVTVIVSNGEIENVDKEYNLSLALSGSAQGEFVFRYYIDGILDPNMVETRNIALSKEIKWTIKGSGVQTAIITVENPETGERKTLIELEIDFTKDPIETNTKEFNENVFSDLTPQVTTAAHTTPAPTLPPATEPPATQTQAPAPLPTLPSEVTPITTAP